MNQRKSLPVETFGQSLRAVGDPRTACWASGR